MKGQSVAGTQTTLLRYGRMHTSTYADTETQQAYLFQCDGNGLFAVSLDRSGANIPRGACVEGWRFRTPSCWASKRSCPRRLIQSQSCAASARWAITSGVRAFPAARRSRDASAEARASHRGRVAHKLTNRLGAWDGDTG
jgi:hypothetical protein